MLRRFLAALAATLLLAAPVGALSSPKKGIWGPARVGGVSQFPIYKELGARVYNSSLNWSAIAPKQPADAAAEAQKSAIKVALLVTQSPPWANGGKLSQWVPRAADWADFLVAAARRYPTVHDWIMWGEPTRAANFQPIPATHPSRPLPAKGKRTVQLYAGLLDAGYGARKGVSSRNVVIGGNSFTGGDISPFNWIRYMRLPNGKRPRMDLYGHNPFTLRRPRLSDPSVSAATGLLRPRCAGGLAGSLLRQGPAREADADLAWGVRAADRPSQTSSSTSTSAAGPRPRG